MKIVRYTTGRKNEYGILEGDTVQSIIGKPYPRIRTGANRHKLSDVRLLAPIIPSKIVAIGLNYRQHAEEVKMPLPSNPLIFLKPPSAIIGPEDNIIYPEATKKLDYEGELAVIIGKTATKVSVKEARGFILGYTCLNDVSARDFQGQGPWARAKGYDTFAPIGPYIETDIDPDNAPLQTLLNGEVKQQSNTSDMIFTVDELVSFVSRVMTLVPGDVLTTGTPSGIGHMQRGDTIEVSIAPIGTLRNYVV